MRDLIEQYQDATHTWRTEGCNGVQNFNKLIEVLGYDDVYDFLMDNSGAIDALVNFIGDSGINDWEDSLNIELMLIAEAKKEVDNVE